ncbi:MAG: NAD(P)H-hydrate dehydratase [Planctomycetaceae bacterium]|nr:NAD(P)H-hydrate dehydratase [Phycisphaerales bacterium]MCE2653715.1 NAD(P)H-hydrate dehydratase [Planctomycetaceae bacterium]
MSGPPPSNIASAPGSGFPIEPLPALPARDPLGHKGGFGRVSVLGGCAAGGLQMTGAPSLAVRAALRAGCGLCQVVAPRAVVRAVLADVPSATGRTIATTTLPGDPPITRTIAPHAASAAVDLAAATSDVLVVGPGLGLARSVGPGVTAMALRAAQQHEVHVVLDADALNALAEVPELSRDFHAPAVITPHPGEFQRLAQALRVDADPLHPATRPDAAAMLAQRLGCVVVLKGPGTVVSDGHRVFINRTGNAALAAGGTGDVLAGLIGGLIAQFVPPPQEPRPWPMPPRPVPPGRLLDLFRAACLAVHVHGLCADRWTARTGYPGGMLATELADEIPAALAEVARSGGPGNPA